ncbi:MAG: CoA transferase [Dehalococcoidia bacterium]
MVRTAGVIGLENNVSETMEKLGVTYDYLRALRPDIIFVRVPAFGSTGPYRNYRALGVHLEGVSGHGMLRHYADLDAGHEHADLRRRLLRQYLQGLCRAATAPPQPHRRGAAGGIRRSRWRRGCWPSSSSITP